MLPSTRQRSIYIATDYAAANLAWLVFNVVRYYTLPYNYSAMTLGQYFSMHTILLGQLLFPVMTVLLYAVSGYYNKVFFKSRLDDVLNAAAVALVSVAVIFLTVLFNDSIDDRMGNIEMVTLLWLLFTLLTSAARLVVTKRAAAKIWHRQLAFNTLIIGNKDVADHLARDLDEKHRTMGLRVVAYADALTPTPVLLDLIADKHIDAIIIAPGTHTPTDTLALINRLLSTGLTIYMTPDAYHLVTTKPRTSRVAGEVLIDVSRANVPESTRNAKRLVDIAASALALVLLSPVFAIIAILIKRDSSGPVFYRQERIGYKKKPFDIIKFRTMRVDAEADGPALSSADDPRITRIGRVLRKYRLDELPQFWNVIKGEMSLVGPRPERQYYLQQIIAQAPYYTLLHQVRPGITSWGMVKYGYASSVDQMVQRMQYDLLYIENVSLSVDLKILFYTVHTVLTGRGV